MSFDLKQFLDDLVPVLGEAGVKALSGELDDLAAGQTGWKQNVLALLSESVDKFGPEVIKIGMDAIDKLLAGEAPVIDWADLATASDIVAALQNAEADHRDEVSAFTVKLSHAFGKILGALVRGLAMG